MPMSSKVFIPNSAISALMKRELRRYVSIPVYITNTSCGFLFAAVYIILIGIANEKAVPYIDMFSDYFQIAPAAEDILYVYALTILISLSSITYASISIEGKQIEVLKSFPVNAQDLFRAKIRFHLSFSIPLILSLNTVMILFLHLPLRYFSNMLISVSFIVCTMLILIVCVMVIWLKKYGAQIYQRL